MVWYTILGVAVVLFIVWFIRTPIFRAHRRSARDPGEAGTRVQGRYAENGGSYYIDGPPK